MANPNKSARFVIAGSLLGAGLLAWLASMGIARLSLTWLALPEGASLVSLDGAAALPEPGEPGDAGEDEAMASALPSLGRGRRGGSKSSYVDPIVGRSIFDSRMAERGGGGGGGGPTNPPDGSLSDLKVVLVATVVTEPAEFSSALIAEEKGDGAVGYGIGDQLLEQAEIVGIEQRKVYLRRSDGSIEFIVMEDGASYAQGSGSKKKGKKKGKGEEDGVEKTGENKYTVSQELIDKVLENPEKLYSQMRVVPHKDSSGNIDGYRMSGIRRKSLFSQLGVKNGDIVHAVNGSPLTSLNAGMEAYNSLQDAKDFTFEITRRNEKQTFEYEIR